MSMELHVLSDRPLNSVVEWQRAITVERYPLRLAADVQFAAVQGFLPATLDGRQTGFECYHDNAAATMNFLGSADFDRQWKHALGLRWLGSKFDELTAAWMAATAYAAATGGIIFDHERGKPLSVEEARATVAAILRDRPRAEAMLEKIEAEFAQKS